MDMEDSGDVVDVLLVQHDQLRQLFVRVSEAAGPDKQTLLDELAALLHRHETGEQQIVHPVMIHEVAQGDAIAEARLAEEQQADHILAGLRSTGVEDTDFDARFAVLHQAVLDHATHEEQDEFPQLRQQLTPERLLLMAHDLRTVQAAI